MIEKIIPPTYGHFQENQKNSNKTKEGIKCIMKFSNCCPIGIPGSNASSANMLTKRMAAMHSKRGSQRMIFSFVAIN